MSVNFYVGIKTVDNGHTLVRQAEPEGFDRNQIVGYWDDDQSEPNDPIYADNPWSMNASNSSARHLLNMLGYDNTELCGSLDPKEVIDHIDLALGMIHDMPGIGTLPSVEKRISPETVLQAMIHCDAFTASALPDDPKGMLIHFCGKDDEYTIRRLTEMRVIAEAAISVGGVLAYA